MQSFDHAALFEKSKVFIDRAITCERASDQSGFQLWCSLSMELLGKSVLAQVHPALVADPTHIASLLAACSVPISPDRKSITFKTVFERLTHICKSFRNEDRDFCMLMADRRNEELHSGKLAYAGIRQLAWVPKFWSVAETLLKQMGKTLEDWVDATAAAKAAEWIASATPAETVEGKLKTAKGRFDSTYATQEERERAQKSTYNPTFYSSLLMDPNVDAIEQCGCPACGCPGAVAGEEWNRNISSDVVADEPWMELETVDYLITSFQCHFCQLKLSGQEETSLAGLVESFATEELREADYEADYGND